MIKLNRVGLHISAKNNGPNSCTFHYVILHFNIDANKINETGLKVLKRAYPKAVRL